MLLALIAWPGRMGGVWTDVSAAATAGKPHAAVEQVVVRSGSLYETIEQFDEDATKESKVENGSRPMALREIGRPISDVTTATIQAVQFPHRSRRKHDGYPRLLLTSSVFSDNCFSLYVYYI